MKNKFIQIVFCTGILITVIVLDIYVKLKLKLKGPK